MDKYQKALNLYEVIKGKPLEEYVYLLKDEDFAIECIEWELGRSPTSQKLWNFYIKFLKDHEKPGELLNVYSRYCRLFVSDQQMREEYLAQIRRSEATLNVTKWWIDYIGIEKHFGSIEAAQNLIEDVKAKNSTLRTSEDSKVIHQLSLSAVDVPRTSFSNVKVVHHDEVADKNFNFKKNMNGFRHFRVFPHQLQDQSFAFPKPLQNYIFDSANNKLKHTLIQTCKYLNYRENQIFCHNLSISYASCMRQDYRQQSRCLRPSYLSVTKLNNYCVTNTLEINPHSFGGQPKDYTHIFSKIVRIIKWDIKFICLVEQTLTLKELNLLPCHQIKIATLMDVEIYGDNGKLRAEDLICLFPMATTKR